MRFIYVLFLLIPIFSYAQENKVELLEVQTDEGILLKGVSHVEDQTINFIVEITSVGFGLKKLETISKRIPPGGEVDIITLKPTPNRECSYSVNFRYTTREKRNVKITELSKEKVVMTSEKVEDNDVVGKTEVAPVKGIVVYSKSGCGRCEYVTNYLNLYEVPFTDLNITEDSASNQQMSKLLFASGYQGGRFKTPVVAVDGEVFYDIADIKAFVKDVVDKSKKD